MGLEEAIIHLERSLLDPEKDWGCVECREEHIQLLNFLKELREYRNTGLTPEQINNLERSHEMCLSRLRDVIKMAQTGRVSDEQTCT